jgi:hypothetical protein
LEIQDGRQGLIFDEKMTILPVDQHGHKVGPIVFILGENIAMYREENRRKSEIQNGCCDTFFRLFFNVKMTHLPLLQYHGDCRMSPIVSIY